jgi:hypothetical protein
MISGDTPDRDSDPLLTRTELNAQWNGWHIVMHPTVAVPEAGHGHGAANSPSKGPTTIHECQSRRAGAGGLAAAARAKEDSEPPLADSELPVHPAG